MNTKNKTNNMNKILFITGTPGVGKTTVADKFNTILSQDYDSKLIKINDLAIENGLIKGEDLEKGYKIVDIDKLSKKLNLIINDFFNINDSKSSLNSKIVIVEGHLSHLCDIEANNIHVDFDFKVVVFRLNPDILQKRLFSRNYSKNKVYENLEAEALGVCSVEAYENHGENVQEIDTSDLKVSDVLDILKAVLFNQKQFPIGSVDFIQWILD